MTDCATEASGNARARGTPGNAGVLPLPAWGRCLAWLVLLLVFQLCVSTAVTAEEARPFLLSAEEVSSRSGQELRGLWAIDQDALNGQARSAVAARESAPDTGIPDAGTPDTGTPDTGAGHREDSLFSSTLSSPATTIPVPGLWNQQPGRQELEQPGFGAATWYTRLLVPRSLTRLALVLPQPKSAARVWMNGREVARQGTVGLTAAEEYGRTGTLVVPLPALETLPSPPGEDGLAVVSLAIEVSNHVHFEGGLDRVPSVRLLDEALLYQQTLLLLNAMVVGGLLLLTAYVLFIFGPQQGWPGLDLPGLLLAGSLRVACTGGVLTALFPEAPLSLFYRLEYLPIYLFMTIYFYTLDGVFPRLMHRLAGRIFTAITLVGCLITVLAPVDQFTHLRDFASAMVVVSCMYFTWRLVLAFRRQMAGARLLAFGGLTLVVAAAHDAMMYAHVFEVGIDWVPLGIVFFLLSHAMVMDARALRALSEVRRLSTDLAALNCDLENQVAQRTRALEEASAVARQEAATKSRFLSALSHEIRTPLNAILGMGRILLRETPRPEQVERLELMNRAGHHLVGILDDVLLLSRAEATGGTPFLVPTDLAALARDVVALLKPAAEGKGLRLTLECRDDVPRWLLLDALPVRQVLINLVNNAIKFTPRGRVAVFLEAAGGELCLRVTDSGPGIPPSARSSVFEPFTRRDHSGTTEGTGLGLAIVQRMVLAMQGRVTVETALSGGASFAVFLPLAACDAPPAGSRGSGSFGDPRLRENRSGEDGMRKGPDGQEGRRLAPDTVTGIPVTGDGSTAGTGGLPPRLEMILPRGMRILVIEDGAESIEVLRLFLAPSRAILTVARTGEQGVTMAATQSFDAILMDVVLPGIDGMEATRRIRALKDDERALIPIIALTASVSDEDRLACIEAGMDDVLPKPFDPDDLLSTLAVYAPAGLPVGEEEEKADPGNGAEGEGSGPRQSAEPPALPASPAIPEALRQKALLVFNEQLPGIHQRLLDALERTDSEAIRQETHRLKGSAATFGLIEISAVAASVERMAKEGQHGEELLTATRELLDRVQDFLG